MRRVLPYGLWPSPLEPERMASLLRITDVQWDRSGRVLIWREERSGRGVLVAREGEGPPRDRCGPASDTAAGISSPATAS